MDSILHCSYDPSPHLTTFIYWCFSGETAQVSNMRKVLPYSRWPQESRLRPQWDMALPVSCLQTRLLKTHKSKESPLPPHRYDTLRVLNTWSVDMTYGKSTNDSLLLLLVHCGKNAVFISLWNIHISFGNLFAFNLLLAAFHTNIHTAFLHLHLQHQHLNSIFEFWLLYFNPIWFHFRRRRLHIKSSSSMSTHALILVLFKYWILVYG